MNSKNNNRQRVVIVSNRLPFTIKVTADGLVFDKSVGGLATGLSSFLTSPLDGGYPREYIWVGWPGSTIGDEMKTAVRERSRSEYNAHPVFLSEDEVEKFYQGFCNKTIWPLFHYFPTLARYEQEYWQQYVKVNRSFCDALLEILQPTDIVWIHDYHLLLLPGFVRERLPNVRIGFFLHIPFPNFELFRQLPRTWRREILNGLLGADLVGFHTFDYMQDFLRCVLRILGYESNMGQIILGDRIVKVGSFPMGIDFQKFHSAAKSPDVRMESVDLIKSLGDVRIILSIDRLDYTKGIVNRLEGFEIFVERNPQWHGKVTLVMVVVPSRIGVEHYEAMKKQIEELVGKINGKFGTLGWIPIIYQYRPLEFTPLVAMYSRSHIALVTPLRDGMNLIAKEYVASRTDQSGMLILSEMAGAAKELGEAIIINPNNREEIAQAIADALDMPVDEQARRISAMQARLQRYDVTHWATDFLNELRSLEDEDRKLSSRYLGAAKREQIVEHYHRSRRRLLLFDYDGTLVSFVIHPQRAIPTEELLGILRSFANDVSNTVVILSGRRRDNLDEWLGSLPVGLAAEHGIWIREQPAENWKMPKPLTSEWKQKIRPLLERYVDRVPGSFIEEKEYSLVWHYRGADPEQSKLASQELTDDLLTFTANIDVQVLQGSKIVEVRCAGINKGTAALQWLVREPYDFILAIGDDLTDEEMFLILPATAYSIHVGANRSRAKFNLNSPREVVAFLHQLVDVKVAT